jgi:phage pi2 protein 07
MRPGDNLDEFKDAKPKTLYVWNLYDIKNVKKFKEIITVIEKLAKVVSYKVISEHDPGGF